MRLTEVDKLYLSNIEPTLVMKKNKLTYSMEQSPSWEANQSLHLVKQFPEFL
jgi:hypothetical protein